MSTPLHARTLRNLRNTRDLRAEMLSLAAELAADSQAEGQVRVIDSAITEATTAFEHVSREILAALTDRLQQVTR